MGNEMPQTRNRTQLADRGARVSCLTEAPVVFVIPAAQERARLMTSRTATCPVRVKLEIPTQKSG
jgi:hypothetical protein